MASSFQLAAYKKGSIACVSLEILRSSFPLELLIVGKDPLF